jgi:hypothetical protein
MNLVWVAAASTVPLIPACLVAWPLWTRRVADNMGAIAGASVVLVAMVGFIAREYGEVEAITRRCIDANIGCHFHPDPFFRYAIFGSIAMVQVFVLFAVGLAVEERLKRQQDYSPEWR